MKYFILAIFAVLSVEMIAATHRVVKTLKFEEDKLSISTIKCENDSIYSSLEYKNIDTWTEKPGQPNLPVYFMRVPLPLEASDIYVDVLKRDIKTYDLVYPTIPVQIPAITSLLSSEPSFTGPNELIYAKEGTYPDKAASMAWTLNSAGVSNEVVVALYPIVYLPRQNKVELSQSMTVSINYSIDNRTTGHNKRMMHTRSSIGLPFYEYCIITRDSLIPSFERIIAWKRTKGIDAGAVSIESILSNSYCSGDTVSGINDDAGKVRQYLQYAYQSGKGKYVFFGGNYMSLPIRYGTGDHDSLSYMKVVDAGIVPTDLYFSELESNWNQDNDSFYGEPFNNMDYGPELFVGRLLCEKKLDINNYTNKMLRYEKNPGNGVFGYLKKVFFSQSDNSCALNIAQNVATTCSDYFDTITILSEYPSAYHSNPTLYTGTQVIDSMSVMHYGYLNWMGHGHPFAICTKSNGNNASDAYGITSVQGDIPYMMNEDGNGLDNLNNKYYPAIAYSTSCTTTPFDIYRPSFVGFPNMGQSFTMGKDYGGPAYIGNTRLGISGFTYRVQKLFNGKITQNSLGESLCYAKMDYNSNYKHYIALSTNLIGCPELHMWTNIPNYFGNIVKTDSNTSDTNLSFTAYSDTVEVAVRDVWGNDDVALYTFHPSYSNLTIPNGKGKLITLKALNHIPEILHLESGSAVVHGRRYVFASSATLGGESNSTFTVDNDADITIEKTGVLRLSGGFKVKQGARLVVR